MQLLSSAAVLATALLSSSANAASQDYTWKSVRIGGGGGFVPGIVFNPTEKGLAYARTDIGGAYRLNADDTWTPITEFVGNDNWNQWGIDAIATDPIDTNRVYAAAGLYTISWDPNPGSILRSTDRGTTWQTTTLPFKVGGNMPGRGAGERLAVDPNKNNIIFFGTREQGLWKSSDYGATWAKVPSFTWTGTYFQDSTSEYTAAKQGLAWVTFDSTSSTKGTATSRIFVGVIDKGLNIFKTEDGGATWAAVTGQPQLGFIPHKGVLEPVNKLLYVTYTNGGGPYDGTNGTVHKYNIASGAWTDISPTPANAASANGWGGFAIDAKNPGTIMVATLNLWWPDANIWRSKDSGATWTPIWEFVGYPTRNKYYKYDISAAPWLQDRTRTDEFIAEIGWMIEALVIDPHDSDHWLYGTGATVYGGRDLTKWDTVHNVTVKSLATGIEETAILGLTVAPGGPPLLSAVGDIGGFYHKDLDVAPDQMFQTPSYGTTDSIDYAGNKPSNIIRSGSPRDTTLPQVAVSSDFGVKWSALYAAAGLDPGQVVYGADADAIVFVVKTTGAVYSSKNQGTFAAVSSLPASAQIASDKRDGNVFYGGSAGSFYVSSDKGTTFTKTATLGSSTVVRDIAVHPSLAGDVWVSTDKGLFHSVNTGKTFTQVSGVTEAWAIAIGAGAASTSYPVIYSYLSTSSGTTLQKSEDQGATWYIISDATHGFGNGASVVLGADTTKYGRIYVGTNGRGIFYGSPAGTIPSPSSSTTVSKTTTAAGVSSTTKATTLTTTTRAPPVSTTTSIRTTTPVVATTTRTTTRVVTTATTTSASSGGPSAGPWGQCGGQGYTGPTACPAGWKCTFSNTWYSQCLQ